MPAGAVPVTFTLTRAVLDGMAAKGINQVGISSNDFALTVGTTSVAMTGVSVAKTAAPATGDLVLTAASKNAAVRGARSRHLRPHSCRRRSTRTVDTNLIPLRRHLHDRRPDARRRSAP